MPFPNRVIPTKVGNGGFTGKTLRVDLTTRTFIAEPTLGVWSNGNTPFVPGSGTDHNHFWGGNGQAYKVLWDEVPNSVKWYSPANRIHFGWGPMAGSGAPSSGRTSMTSLAPVHCAPGATVVGVKADNTYTTQAINCVPGSDILDGYAVSAVANGHMGGHFSAECKYAGWDSIVVQGKASGPVYIAIFDDDVKIIDCPQLWGHGLYRTVEEISQAMGPGCHVAAIGQAGQNMVPQSVVMCDKSHSGGAGMGAVMGSKNLVGIGALGTGTVKVAAGKTKWRTLIENAMRIVGACYQACGPTTAQPWAEYYGGTRWYATKGMFWGAANPPVDVGTCDPHETDPATGAPVWRQNMGYRCFKNDLGALGESHTVRMDGCNACPVRCHQMVNIPTAIKWGEADTYAMNTCTGWWGNALADSSKYTTAMATNGSTAWTSFEAYVVGQNTVDDFGLWNNYGVTQSVFNYLIGNGTAGGTTGAARLLQANVKGNTITVRGAACDEWNYLTKGHSSPVAVASGGPGPSPAVGDAALPGYSATGTNADSALPGYLTLRWMGDLRCIKEAGRLMARMVPGSLFGQAACQSVEWTLHNWYQADATTGLKTTTPLATAIGTNLGSYWGWGGAWHHGDYETGCLINQGYNTHPQNHCWGPIIMGGSPWPDSLAQAIVEDMFKQLGYGTGMGLAADYTTLMCQEKARAARWAQNQKDMTDSTGLCSWVYPYWTSPLKERGYRGDMTLPCQYFNALTGSNLTPYQFELESERFFTLQCCLTLKRFGNINRRWFHDTTGKLGPAGAGPGGAAGPSGQYGGSGGNQRYTQWNTAGGVLESYYKEMRWDIATGAPTIEGLAALGLDAAHGTDVAGYFAAAGMPLPHLPATDPLVHPPLADPEF